MSDDLVLQVRDLNVWYRPSGTVGRRKRQQVLHDVSFKLHRGEILGLVGESGSGKTTLARTILGFVPDYTGTITHYTKRPQMVFQDPASSLNPSRTVGWILAEPLRIHKLCPPREFAGRAEALLERVGLPRNLLGRYPHELSGGQRQRVGIARALAVEPRLVVCDEPVSALDVSVQAQMLNLLLDLQADEGLTYVLVSHDLSVVRHSAGRVCVMFLGRVCEIGPTEEVFTAPRHPYTKLLLAAVPRPDPTRRNENGPPLAGEIPSPVTPPSGCRFRTRCPYAQARCAQEVPKLQTEGARGVACHFPLR